MKINESYLKILRNRDDLSFYELKDELNSLFSFETDGLTISESLKDGVEILTDQGEILNESKARKGILGIFNRLFLNERNRKYYRLLTLNPNATRIMAEGDSWFCYPNPLGKIKDVIAHLQEDYLIYTSALGGDWVANMSSKKEWNRTLKKMMKLECKCLLLSAGGNDILGSVKQKNQSQSIPRSMNFIKDYSTGMSAGDLIQPAFYNAIDVLHSAYEKMMNDIRSLYGSNGIPVLVNTYDYPFPVVNQSYKKSGNYLGKVMFERKISDPNIQREIAVIMINTFVGMLEKIQSKYNFVHVIKSLNLTTHPDNWEDEIHLSTPFMSKVADNFTSKLSQLNISPLENKLK